MYKNPKYRFREDNFRQENAKTNSTSNKCDDALIVIAADF